MKRTPSARPRSRRSHLLIKAARRTTLYVTVAGIAMAIVLPVFFLTVLSLMSDFEAYNEWPLPVVPAFRVPLKVERVGDTYRISVFSRTRADHFSLIESADVHRVMSFLERKTNARVSEQRLRAAFERAEDAPVFFSAPKSLSANFRTFFRVTPEALPALRRSLQTALATICISLLIGGTAGYAFARYRIRGHDALKLSVLFVRIFPAVAVAVPMVVILGKLGLYDRPLGLSLAYSVGQIALTVWVTAGIFLSIPRELEEAALVCGTTRTGAFRRITLPLALPGLAACAMYAFIGSWNETIQAIVLTQFHPTFPVVVYQTLVGSKGLVNLAAAGGVIMAVPAVVFACLIRKYILTMWGAGGR